MNTPEHGTRKVKFLMHPHSTPKTARPRRVVKICPVCHRDFSGERNYSARFCSPECRRNTTEPRFWSHVRKTEECWLWTGSLNPNGYGQLGTTHNYVNKVFLAHRYSYELHFGPIPAGLYVCHKCDNPPCVNPAHLFLGTNSENILDCIAKGRFGDHRVQGARHGCAKLTDAQVYAIRERCNRGDLRPLIAQDFGVSLSLVSHIHTRRVWKHLP